MKSSADATYSVSASAVIGVLAYAESRGVATDDVLASSGIATAALEGPEARVPQAAYNAVWERLATSDADFGLHFAERLNLEAFGLVGQLVVKCRTFGEGLERVVAYSRILHDAGRVEVEREGANVVVYPGCRGLAHEFPRHIAEFAAASAVVLARRVSGEDVRPLEVRFRHAAPASLAEHARIFGVVPSFDELETSLVFAATVLGLRVVDPEPGVVMYLDAYAREVLARLPVEDDVTSQVERAIAATMSRGVPDAEAIASSLGMSARTLQRRLAERETSFQSLVDGVRRSYAERYLAGDKLAVSEIAFLVGFADPSNFHRAFRRWTGMTPAAFRERARGKCG